MEHILDVSCEVQAWGSNLGGEHSLLVLQAVTHVTLEGFRQDLVSGREETGSHAVEGGKTHGGTNVNFLRVQGEK